MRLPVPHFLIFARSIFYFSTFSVTPHKSVQRVRSTTSHPDSAPESHSLNIYLVAHRSAFLSYSQLLSALITYYRSCRSIMADDDAQVRRTF